PAGQLIDASQHFVNVHLLSAMKRIGGIAPCAPQVTSRQADKNTWQASARDFSLDRFENFGDEHKIYRMGANCGLESELLVVSLSYFPGRYCALAVSVSQITMSVTRAPAGNALTWPVTWS